MAESVAIWDGSVWRNIHANQAPVPSSVNAWNGAWQDIVGVLSPPSNEKFMWDGALWVPLDIFPALPDLYTAQAANSDQSSVELPLSEGAIGDLMILAVVGAGGSPGTPSGYIRFISTSTDDLHLRVFYKTATTTSEQVGVFGGAFGTGAIIARYENASQALPLEDNFRAGLNAGGSLVVDPVAGIAAFCSSCVVAWDSLAQGCSVAGVGPYQNRVQVDANGFAPGIAMHTLIQETGTTTGPVTVTNITGGFLNAVHAGVFTTNQP